MNYRPTPSFIAVMIGLVLGWFCITVLVAVNKHRINKQDAVQISRNQWGQRPNDSRQAYIRWKEIARTYH